jgi:hypothetical protein
VPDPELAVLDDDGDDFAAVDAAEVDLDSGGHEAALAGDRPSNLQAAAGAAGAPDILSGQAPQRNVTDLAI